MEGLRTGAVVPDVVGAPPSAELVAARGQFAYQIVEFLVVRVAAGFGAEDGDAGVSERSQFGWNRWAFWSRKVNRARFAGRCGWA